jgi:ATP-dependent DNA helicase RecG
MINPEFLKKANFKGRTNLKRIENHRLEELIYQDVKIYGPTPIRDIHHRIGSEISKNRIQKTLKAMCKKGTLESEGVLRGTKYFIRQTG